MPDGSRDCVVTLWSAASGYDAHQAFDGLADESEGDLGGTTENSP